MNRETFDSQWVKFQERGREDGRFQMSPEKLNPILTDDSKIHTELDFSFDYFSHTAWGARKLAEYKPQRHVDFSSYVYFAGLCSAFIPDFVFCDIRPINSPFENLRVQRADMTSMKEFASESESSISSLHCVEHAGLGRYGDAINPLGDKWAANELSRILKPGGQLLIVLPMSEDQNGVYFNAHRIYSLEQVRALFSGLAPVSFEYIYGEKIHTGAVPTSGHYTGLMVFSK